MQILLIPGNISTVTRSLEDSIPGKKENMRSPTNDHPKAITDAAKRVSDIVNGQAIAQPWDVITRSFMAFRLSDGSSDGVLYGSRDAAIANQLSPDACMYLSMREAPGGMLPMQAQALLDYYRMHYDAGGRVSTQARGQMIMPLAREEVAAHCARFLRESGYKIDRYRKD